MGRGIPNLHLRPWQISNPPKRDFNEQNKSRDRSISKFDQLLRQLADSSQPIAPFLLLGSSPYAGKTQPIFGYSYLYDPSRLPAYRAFHFPLRNAEREE